VSDKSAIEWTDATWNPVTGCTHVSPGCDHCYALTFAERFRGVPGHPYEQGFDLKLWPQRLELPLTWRKPRRIFVNSMPIYSTKMYPTTISSAFSTRWCARTGTFSRCSRSAALVSPASHHRYPGSRTSGRAYPSNLTAIAGGLITCARRRRMCASSVPNHCLVHSIR